MRPRTSARKIGEKDWRLPAQCLQSVRIIAGRGHLSGVDTSLASSFGRRTRMCMARMHFVSGVRFDHCVVLL